MYEIIINTLTLSFLWVLFKESTIDIKTMYVTDNISLSLLVVSLLAIIANFINSPSLLTLKDPLLGFLFGGIIPFSISYVVYLIQKNKNKVKKNTNEEKIDEDIQMDEEEILMNSKYVDLIVAIFGFVSLFMLTYIPESSLANAGCLSICMSAALTAILLVIFKKYAALPVEESNAEDCEGGIGGGDIIIFALLGLLLGPAAVIIIFIYGVLSQLPIVVIYSVIKKVTKKKSSHVPFVPGITLGMVAYLLNVDVMGYKTLIELLMG